MRHTLQCRHVRWKSVRSSIWRPVHPSKSERKEASKLEDDSRPCQPLPPGESSVQSPPARKLLRNILREATYLPDPYARDYVREFALARFRRTEFEVKKPQNDEQYIKKRLRRDTKTANKALNTLISANGGDQSTLLKVLSLVYGRRGRRRRELMRPLMPTAAKDTIEKSLQKRSEDSEDLEEDDLEEDDLEEDTVAPGLAQGLAKAAASKHKTGENVRERILLKQLSPALHALVKSQMLASPPKHTRVAPKQLQPELPKHNSKRKPLPQSRVQHIAYGWYSHVLARTLPPLPTKEWYTLRDWASARQKPEPVPRWRTRTMTRRRIKKLTALELVVPLGKKRLPDTPRVSRRSAVTPRFLQRVYAEVFGQCPLMDWNNQKNEWVVTWGHHALHDLQPPRPDEGEERKSGRPVRRNVRRPSARAQQLRTRTEAPHRADVVGNFRR